LATFVSGLRKDIAAAENAVASLLSNGFVDGTNSKRKTLKRRCTEDVGSSY
jgi:transposase